MAKITQQQAKQLIKFVQENEIVEVFEQIKAFGLTDYHRFEQEYISGRYHFDYHERLQVYINSLAETNFEVKLPNYDLFISFSSKNEAEVGSLVKSLREANISVFYSKEDLGGHSGVSFIPKINAALRNAQHFVLYCTPEAVASKYVKHECDTFYGRHIEGGKKNRIFILRGNGFSMDLLREIHFEFIQTTDLSGIFRFFGKVSPQEKERLREAEEAREALEAELIRKEAQAERLQEEAQAELKKWELCQKLDNISAYQSYLQFYPQGKYASKAERRLEKLQKSPTPYKTPPINQTQLLGGAALLLILLMLFVWQPWKGSAEASEEYYSTDTLTNSTQEKSIPEEIAKDKEEKKKKPTEEIAKDKEDEKKKSTEKIAKDKEDEKKKSAEKIAKDKEEEKPQKPSSVLPAVIVALERNMVQIRGGTFMMGSPTSEPDRNSDETQHQVTLSDFKIGKYEVTQAQWVAVMGSNPSNFKGCDKCPVESVSWKDIEIFLQKLNTMTGKQYRLPTEAEWEYACRAGTTTPFHTGDNLTTNQANYHGDYPYNGNSKGQNRQKTTPVGSFAPNAWGLYDMHGNVWEWCSDLYGDYPNGALTNPKGPERGSLRMLRGGSWGGRAQDSRSAIRNPYTPTLQLNYIGFRLASF